MTASGQKSWGLNPESGAPEYFTLMFKWTGALFYASVYLLGLTVSCTRCELNKCSLNKMMVALHGRQVKIIGRL